MPLTSTDSCPSCTTVITLTRRDGFFVCPFCGCEFRHHRRKWLIGIPSVVGIAIFLWAVTPIPPILITFIASAGAGFVISRIPPYVIVSPGRDIPAGEFVAVPPPAKESRWFLALLGSLVAVIVGILIWAIWSAI